MTASEKEFAHDILARQKKRWDYLEAERLANLPGLVTKEVLPSLPSSFEYAQTLPPRLDTGFLKFYELLGRGPKRS